MMHPDVITSVWDDPRNIDTLKSMWAEGASASEIARALGHGVTRAAVIGKVHRLKLPSHGISQQSRNRIEARRQRAEQQIAAKERRQAEGIKARVEKRQRSAALAIREHSTNQPFRAGSLPVEDEGVDVTALIGFASRRIGKQCSWISGEPTADALCCGKPVLPGTEWCAAHYARVFGGRHA